jgi:hypothetical protein
MQTLTFEHPLTATELFARSALKPFLAESRFQRLSKEARVQAVD